MASVKLLQSIEPFGTTKKRGPTKKTNIVDTLSNMSIYENNEKTTTKQTNVEKTKRQSKISLTNNDCIRNFYFTQLVHTKNTTDKIKSTDMYSHFNSIYPGMLTQSTFAAKFKSFNESLSPRDEYVYFFKDGAYNCYTGLRLKS